VDIATVVRQELRASLHLKHDDAVADAATLGSLGLDSLDLIDLAFWVGNRLSKHDRTRVDAVFKQVTVKTTVAELIKALQDAHLDLLPP